MIRKAQQALLPSIVVVLAVFQLAGVVVSATAESVAARGAPVADEALEMLIEDKVYSDLAGDAWYFDAALFCRANGLLQSDGNTADAASEAGAVGYAGDVFDADSPLTFRDCQAAVVRLRYLANGTSESESLPQASIRRDYEPDSYVNREQFVAMLAAALDIDALPRINDFVGVPGGFGWTETGGAVRELYRAGILVGDEHGYFSPFKPIVKAEAAAILMRFLDPAARLWINVPFPIDESVALSKIGFDVEVLEEFFGFDEERRAVEYVGEAICLKTYDGNSWQQTVYSLDGALALSESLEYSGGYLMSGDIGERLGIADGVSLSFFPGDETYHYSNLDGHEIKTEKPIYDATPFCEGYAAVRYERSMSGPVQVIDKEGNQVADLPGGYLLHRIYPSNGIVQGFSSFSSYPHVPYLDAIVGIDTGEVMKAAALFDKPVVMSSEFRHGFAEAYIVDHGTYGILRQSNDLVRTDFGLIGLDLDLLDFEIADWNEDYIIIAEKTDAYELASGGQEALGDAMLVDYAQKAALSAPHAQMSFADIAGMPSSTIVIAKYGGLDGREYEETVIMDAVSQLPIAILPSSTIQSENCLLVVSDYDYCDAFSYGKRRCVTDIYGNRLSPVLPPASGLVEQHAVAYALPSEMTDPEKRVNDGMLYLYDDNVYRLRSDKVYSLGG